MHCNLDKAREAHAGYYYCFFERNGVISLGWIEVYFPETADWNVKPSPLDGAVVRMNERGEQYPVR